MQLQHIGVYQNGFGSADILRWSLIPDTNLMEYDDICRAY